MFVTSMTMRDFSDCEKLAGNIDELQACFLSQIQNISALLLLVGKGHSEIQEYLLAIVVSRLAELDPF